MSHNKMLIDATHPEETRVVVLRDGRVEEFDYESAARRLLRGSIYLAKITRVEPSLQAAFVDYGGNRHGFLAFGEIHPDYYQIPHSDRQALLEQEQADHRRADADDDDTSDDANDDTPADEHDARKAVDRDAHADNDEDDDDRDDADDDDGYVEIVPVSRADGNDEPDPEDNAIDVTHLLPPEEEAAQPSPNDTLPNESREQDDTALDTPDGKPPRTIAASQPTDDHIKSEIVTPGAADEQSEPQPAVTFDPQPEPTPQDAGTLSATESDPIETAVTDHVATDHVEPEQPTAQRVQPDEQDDGESPEPEPVENVAREEDALEELPMRPRRRARSYKIQEVIKRRQIVLIQVVKEERGNKGAALTTYLSLAGRYTVLMPNTARGGGISRKITNVQDRKRLKAIAQELDVPEGMGLIIRTAGAARTKQEIKRDFEYLLRLWENVRDLTLQSTAPSLVYEEGDLIKRSIRDLYSKDIDQILVAGEEAHKEAKSFMRMLMPSHAKNVVKYEEPQPLFARYGIESQLNAMFSPVVQLRSGGYLVINQTEALVAVDVNSGKATKEFSIEET
ncbi:MAG TPA: ribonuclease E/G, partial [Hyphomicrobiaceae bacterium]|nr:ribonuclease E/G [Hyphomicrobiaceae bacterium]